MNEARFHGRYGCRFDPARVVTPAFVVDEGLLADNLALLAQVKQATGCKILLALKCFAMFSVFPLLRQVLDGVCCSSPHEARLGREEFGREVHSFAAAYSEHDIEQLAVTSDHLVFNSFGQWQRFRSLAETTAKRTGRELKFGLRVNPEHSEGATPIYDPCAPGSRLGIRRKDFRADLLDGISGLHWHNLCEQDADCLQRTVAAVERNFAEVIPQMAYINFGGGHHITRPGYQLDLLIDIVGRFQDRWGVQVYLEPGEAVALNAGYLVATVLDVVNADMPIAIIDASVPAHMPDVLEMPYRPHIVGSGEAGEKAWTCRIGGLSCLAGDVAGEYSFDAELAPGDRLVFTDMAIYTMVKTNTFNGVQLPSIMRYRPDDDELVLVRRFGYEEFKTRLS
ncbi:carboxynorspermidine decarboxylase [Desulfobulbus propionicus DSM 2032]|uniref:Carboxynorspermidine/carboxyspermidine decarboxylase n=1 Tax=Desulfobulbus propionicus (strain ATCC 33891 / DSM 2032 / VKM B-1956 / 1pr3) TaxID=577650 RepID=A0A7U4DQM6_DESPD|nr:carboxynorspermidine decarboxylase [Desulfobulbus propionicus]ADW19167.1 carboxynorspermidine decarboxylase [Desulfobulbus propionicus DSM 2032]